VGGSRCLRLDVDALLDSARGTGRIRPCDLGTLRTGAGSCGAVATVRLSALSITGFLDGRRLHAALVQFG